MPTCSECNAQVNQLTGKARISDVIRSRFNAWKPDKSSAQLTGLFMDPSV